MIAFTDMRPLVPSEPPAPSALLLSAVMVMTDGLLVTDEQGRIVDANAAAGIVLGAPVNALRGQLIQACAQQVGNSVLSDWIVRTLGTSDASPLEFSVGEGSEERVWEALLRSGTTLDGTAFCTVQFRDTTARARSARERSAREAALRESEQRLRSVIDVGHAAFTIARAHRAADGTIDRFEILDVNTRAADMVGRSPEELLGRSLLDVFPDSQGWDLWAQCCSVLITGEPLDTTQLAPTADQPLRWLRRQLVRVPGDAVAIAWRDVTRRQRERVALEQSEARHRDLFENNGAVQLMADIETARIVDVNRAAVAFYGWPRDTMRAMYVTDLEAVTLEHWRETTSAIVAGTGLRVQREHRVADGELRQVEAFIGVVAIAGRRVLHVIIQDITDRVRADRQLRESEARFRAVIAGMQEGVVLHDESGAIRTYNPSAERILGLSGAQLLGLEPINREWSAVHEDGTLWPADTHPARIALQTGRSQARSLMGVPRGDGTFGWLHVTADPLVRSGEQRPYASVAVFTDVTEARNSGDRLRDAQKLEAIVHLVGGVAHDFNNLLTVIRGSTGFVRESVGPTSPHLEDLDAIERATERAEELTRRLLAVGRRPMLRAESV